MNHKFLTSTLAGFVAGVFVASFINFGWATAAFFVLVGAALFIAWELSSQAGTKLPVAVLFFVAMSLGVLRYQASDDFTKTLNKFLGSRSQFEAVVVEEPDERENYTKYVVEVDGNKMLVTANKYPEFKYGDKVNISGVLKKPGNMSEFDWVAYLAKDNIGYEMFYPEIDFISSGNGSFVKNKMLLLKGNFLVALGKAIPEPYASFMGGLTIGAKKSIPKKLQDDFKATGVIHIVVLSGYNISLVADTIIKMFSFMPKALGVGLGSLGIILFTLMAGASATAVRASIMALLAILARTTGRIYEITWALFITGFVMIMHNPKILRFDTSFQLSFLATLSLIYLAPKLKEKFSFVPERWQMREIVASTISAQVFVLPLLLYKMGNLSLVALPVNFLILIFIPLTMILGFLTAGFGMLSQLLSIPLGWASYLFLRYEVFVVEFFAGLPFASVEIKNFPLWLMLLVYVIYAIIVYKKNGKNKPAI